MKPPKRVKNSRYKPAHPVSGVKEYLKSLGHCRTSDEILAEMTPPPDSFEAEGSGMFGEETAEK